VSEAIYFNGGDTAKRAPHGDAQLIATDIGEPGVHELARESLASSKQ